MFTTSKMKRKPYGGPQKLKTLTTNAVKLKDEKDILANAIIQRDALARRVRTMPTRKVSGPMLVTGGTEGRAQNEKRKRLMQKLQLIRLREKLKIKAAVKVRQEGSVVAVPSIPEIKPKPSMSPEISAIPPYLDDNTKWSLPKKKKGRPKKETKEIK